MDSFISNYQLLTETMDHIETAKLYENKCNEWKNMRFKTKNAQTKYRNTLNNTESQWFMAFASRNDLIAK